MIANATHRPPLTTQTVDQLSRNGAEAGRTSVSISQNVEIGKKYQTILNMLRRFLIFFLAIIGQARYAVQYFVYSLGKYSNKQKKNVEFSTFGWVVKPG